MPMHFFVISAKVLVYLGVKMEFFAASIKNVNKMLDVTFIVEANSGKIQIQTISLLARQLVY